MATRKLWAVGAAAYLALSGACLADTIAARPTFFSTTITFVTSTAYLGGTLTVAGPDAYAATVNTTSGLPSINLAQFGKVPDGQYTYQLFAATAALETSVSASNNGRANPNIKPREPAALSGVFVVKGGSIVPPSTAAE